MCCWAEKIRFFAKRSATRSSQPAWETSIAGPSQAAFFVRLEEVIRGTCKVLVNSNFDPGIFAVEHRGSLSAPIHCRASEFHPCTPREDLRG